MALTFEQDLDGPEGMGYFIDDESGMIRYGYDPELADTVERGFPLTEIQETDLNEMKSENPVDAPKPIEPGKPQDPTQLPGVTGAKNPITGLPTVTDAAAERWNEAMSGGVMPVVRPGNVSGMPTQAPAGYERGPGYSAAGGYVAPPPEAPPGTILKKATVEPGTPGHQYDQAAEDARWQEFHTRAAEQENRNNEYQKVFNEQQIQLNQQRHEDEVRRQQENERAQRFEKELTDVVAKEINQDRLKENSGLFGSILGIIGEGLAYLSTPDSGFGRMQAAMDRRIQRDIDAQKEKKESTINLLTKKLGSAQQAEAHYQASVRNLGINVLESRLKSLGVGDQFADRIQAMRDQVTAYNNAAMQASYGKPGKSSYEFGVPDAAKGTGTGKVRIDNDTTKRLESLGITTKLWDEALGEKVNGNQNAPTLSQSAQDVNRIDADINLLTSIAAANGGTIPTTGLLRIPEQYRDAAARAGLKDGMKAEEVGQILDGYVNRQARSYGGAITDSDRDAALKETGTSTEGKLRFLERLRDETNNSIRGTLSRKFPGIGNEAMEILLDDSSRNTGIVRVRPKPLEVENGPPAAERGDKSATVRGINSSSQRVVDPKDSKRISGKETPFTPEDMAAYVKQRVKSDKDVEDLANTKMPSMPNNVKDVSVRERQNIAQEQAMIFTAQLMRSKGIKAKNFISAYNLVIQSQRTDGKRDTKMDLNAELDKLK